EADGWAEGGGHRADLFRRAAAGQHAVHSARARQPQFSAGDRGDRGGVSPTPLPPLPGIGVKTRVNALMASNSARLISHYRRTSSMCWPKVAPRTCVGKIAWGRGDVSLGRYPGHQSRLVAPPLSTGAALHARPWAEGVRASRPISPSE